MKSSPLVSVIITNFNKSDSLTLNIPHLNANMAKNILCSFALVSELGIDIATFKKQINSFPYIPIN